MLIVLRQIINQNTTFSKLRGVNDPYPFLNWADDGSYFRYTVRHKSGVARKRVFVQELRNLLEYSLNTKQDITRDLFKQYCPKTNSDGPCGFAVIASVISLLGVGRYEGSKTGIRLNDTERLRTLLA